MAKRYRYRSMVVDVWPAKHEPDSKRIRHLYMPNTEELNTRCEAMWEQVEKLEGFRLHSVVPLAGGFGDHWATSAGGYGWGYSPTVALLLIWEVELGE